MLKSVWPRPTVTAGFRRALLTASIVGALICGDTMSDGFAEQSARTWKTNQMKLLNSPELINSTVRALDGALPGTNKPYDAQIVSDEIVQLLLAEVRDQRGANVETALAALGALTGFSVQMSLRETLVKSGKMAEERVFVVAETKTGEKVYFGDLANEGLFGGGPGVYSVYTLIGGGAQKAGAKVLPDVNEIAKYVASTVGTDKFGVPRLPTENMPHAAPIELLDEFWNPIRNFMVLKVQAPLQWPLVLGLASQKMIVMGKDAFDPTMAAQLVMEIAVAMAKIDPAKVRYAYFQSY